jgi:hypothetical protein
MGPETIGEKKMGRGENNQIIEPKIEIIKYIYKTCLHKF